MQKWEYHIENLYTEEDWTQASIKDWLELLNRYGIEGWELVSIRDNLAYFKRPFFTSNMPQRIDSLRDWRDWKKENESP